MYMYTCIICTEFELDSFCIYHLVSTYKYQFEPYDTLIDKQILKTTNFKVLNFQQKHHYQQYPVNYLRNVALNGSLTRWVLTSDADLLPSPNTYKVLQTLVEEASSAEWLRSNEIPVHSIFHNRELLDCLRSPAARCAFVVPAFECVLGNNSNSSSSNNNNSSLDWCSAAHTKEQLRHEFVERETVVPAEWPARPLAQLATNSARWFAARATYELTHHWEEGYAPHLLLSRLSGAASAGREKSLPSDRNASGEEEMSSTLPLNSETASLVAFDQRFLLSAWDRASFFTRLAFDR